MLNGQHAGWLDKKYNPIATAKRKRDDGDDRFFRDCTVAELDFRLSAFERQPEVTLDRLDRRRRMLVPMSDIAENWMPQQATSTLDPARVAAQDGGPFDK